MFLQFLRRRSDSLLLRREKPPIRGPLTDKELKEEMENDISGRYDFDSFKILLISKSK